MMLLSIYGNFAVCNQGAEDQRPKSQLLEFEFPKNDICASSAIATQSKGEKGEDLRWLENSDCPA
jgi:hypothetical protein